MKTRLIAFFLGCLLTGVSAYARPPHDNHVCHLSPGSCDTQLTADSCNVAYEAHGTCGGYNCKWHGKVCSAEKKPCYHPFP